MAWSSVRTRGSSLPRPAKSSARVTVETCRSSEPAVRRRWPRRWSTRTSLSSRIRATLVPLVAAGQLQPGHGCRRSRQRRFCVRPVAGQVGVHGLPDHPGEGCAGPPSAGIQLPTLVGREVDLRASTWHLQHMIQHRANATSEGDQPGRDTRTASVVRVTLRARSRRRQAGAGREDRPAWIHEFDASAPTSALDLPLGVAVDDRVDAVWTLPFLRSSRHPRVHPRHGAAPRGSVETRPTSTDPGMPRA